MRALATCGLFTADAAERSVSRALGEASRQLNIFQCDAVVLDSVVSHDLLGAWAPQLVSQTPTVCAVHAPSPGPQTARSGASFEATDLRLASGDAGERAEALHLVRPALDTAVLVHAPCVVLEAGLLPIQTGLAALEAHAAHGTLDAPRARMLADTLRSQRMLAGARAVDGLSFALDALLPVAEDRDLWLVLAEQRGLDWGGSRGELAAVLERFAGAQLAWWADPAGSAHGEALLPGWQAAEPIPPPPTGVQWRLPRDETAWGLEPPDQRLTALPGGAGDASGLLQVLSPEDGTLGPWHRHVWDALPS